MIASNHYTRLHRACSISRTSPADKLCNRHSAPARFCVPLAPWHAVNRDTRSTTLLKSTQTSQQAPPSSASIHMHEGIMKVSLPKDSFEGFGDDLEEFANASGITLVPSIENPLEYLQYMDAAAAYVQKFLPAAVLNHLQRFMTELDSPSVMFIEGLPVADTPLPPTPISGLGGCDLRLPGNELLLVGLARIIGDPYVTQWQQDKFQSNSLVKYLVKEPNIAVTAEQPLLMHQDYSHTPFTVQAFMLLGLRPDVTGKALTLACDNRYLLSQLSPHDQELLRNNKVYVKFNEISDIAGWYAIDGDRANPEVKPNTNLQVWGDTDEVTAAYFRLQELALELSQAFFLKPGSLFVINNRRAVHGRKAFTPNPIREEGRWLGRVHCAAAGDIFGNDATHVKLVV